MSPSSVSSAAGGADVVKLGLVGAEWPCRPGRAVPAVVVKVARDAPLRAHRDAIGRKLGLTAPHHADQIITLSRNVGTLPQAAPGRVVSWDATPAALGFDKLGVLVATRAAVLLPVIPPPPDSQASPPTGTPPSPPPSEPRAAAAYPAYRGGVVVAPPTPPPPPPPQEQQHPPPPSHPTTATSSHASWPSASAAARYLSAPGGAAAPAPVPRYPSAGAAAPGEHNVLVMAAPATERNELSEPLPMHPLSRASEAPPAAPPHAANRLGHPAPAMNAVVHPPGAGAGWLPGSVGAAAPLWLQGGPAPPAEQGSGPAAQYGGAPPPPPDALNPAVLPTPVPPTAAPWTPAPGSPEGAAPPACAPRPAQPSMGRPGGVMASTAFPPTRPPPAALHSAASPAEALCFTGTSNTAAPPAVVPATATGSPGLPGSTARLDAFVPPPALPSTGRPPLPGGPAAVCADAPGPGARVRFAPAGEPCPQMRRVSPERPRPPRAATLQSMAWLDGAPGGGDNDAGADADAALLSSVLDTLGHVDSGQIPSVAAEGAHAACAAAAAPPLAFPDGSPVSQPVDVNALLTAAASEPAPSPPPSQAPVCVRVPSRDGMTAVRSSAGPEGASWPAGLMIPREEGKPRGRESSVGPPVPGTLLASLAPVSRQRVYNAELGRRHLADPACEGLCVTVSAVPTGAGNGGSAPAFAEVGVCTVAGVADGRPFWLDPRTGLVIESVDGRWAVATDVAAGPDALKWRRSDGPASPASRPECMVAGQRPLPLRGASPGQAVPAGTGVDLSRAVPAPYAAPPADASDAWSLSTDRQSQPAAPPPPSRTPTSSHPGETQPSLWRAPLPTHVSVRAAQPRALASPVGPWPERVHVIARDAAHLSGVYTRLREALHGYPAWGMADCTLYASSDAGNWMLTDRPGTAALNRGWVRSRGAHDGRAPHRVGLWEAWQDHTGWAAADVSVVEVQ